MATAARQKKPAASVVVDTARSRVTSEQVWRHLDKASFAVISYVTPAGESRSSGVVYKTLRKRLYIAVAADSWKARHIGTGKRVSVTVPVRRGGLIALVLPIPPATISFPAAAVVHPAGSATSGWLSKELGPLLPPERRETAVVIELTPVGHFLTYGVDVPLIDMQKPELARRVVPVESA